MTSAPEPAPPRLPLDGITVVSLEQAVAAPFATRHLADLGARVLKVERPDGGDFARRYDETVLGQSSYFVWLNRSKESLTLDLKSPDGLDILHRLLAQADVFVQNLAPGATARLGLDAPNLQARHPRLIVCDLSGYGPTGPWSDRKAYDMLVQFEVGLVALTGTPETPSRVGVSVVDIAAGTYAYSGILAALLRRATTGEASAVEVNLFDAIAEWMGSPLYYTAYGGTSPARVGAEHATIAPYGPYESADGVAVAIAVQNDREWRALCGDVLGRPELADDERFDTNSRRVANRAVLNAVIAARFAELPAADAVDRLDRAGIANARVNTVHDLVEHPVLRERDRWRTVSTPGGPVDALLPPVGLSGVTPRMDPVPALGEHTDAILRSLGADAEEIARLRAERVI